MISEKYLPDVTTCLTQIQKQDELKLLKLLHKSRKAKIVGNKPLDPIYSEVYIGWQEELNKRKLKKRISTQVQLGEKYHKLQPSYRDGLRDRDPSNLHSKSVQLPFLSRKGLKVGSKNDSGRASDFLVYRQKDGQKFEPTRTDHKETQKMRKKLIKAVDQVFKSQESLEQSVEKKKKILNNSHTKKVKLDRIKKTEGAIPKHIRQWQKIDIFKLQTYFLKLLWNKDQYHPKTTIEEIREQSTIDRMNIPKKQKIPDYIRQYKPTNPQINIDELIKNPDFQIVIDDDEIYFGCVVNGKRHKTGISVGKNSRFEGEWVNDNRYQGYQITPQGYYKGRFKDNIRHGQGTFLWKNGEKYEGQWRNGSKHGSGVWKSDKGDSYIGQWNHGKVQGYGVHLTSNGQRYEGNFHNFLKHGHGKELFPNGDIYEGEYKTGKPNGKGKYTWKNQISYEGQFVEGYRHGKGTLIAEGYMKFVGNFIGEKVQGKGQIQYGNGDSFVGNFKQGQKHGKGTMKYKNNHRIITGIWRNNEREESELEIE